MTLFICKCISSFPSSFAYLRVYVIKISRLVGKSWWSKLSAQTFESCAAAWVSQLPGPTWVSQPHHLFTTSRVSSPQAGSQVFLSDICVKLLVWVFLYIVPSYLYLHQYFCMKCNISVRSWANNLNDRLATGLFIERIIGSIIEALVLVPVVGRPLPGGWHLLVCRHPFTVYPFTALSYWCKTNVW